MSHPTTVDSTEMLRRLVLQAPDGHSAEIAAALRVMGYGATGSVRVRGATITVYLGGQEPDRPSVADSLELELGGTVSVGSNPTDWGWYEWTWTAPLDAVDHAT